MLQEHLILNTEQIMNMILTANPNTKTVGLLYSMSEANSEKPIAEAKAYLDEKGLVILKLQVIQMMKLDKQLLH